MVIIMKKLALILMGSFICQYGIAQDAVFNKDINTIALTEDYLLGKWEINITLDKNECLNMIENMDIGFSDISNSFVQDARDAQEFTGHCKLIGTSIYHRNYDVSDYFVISVKVNMLDTPLAIGEANVSSTSKWKIYEAHNEVVMTMKKENISFGLDYEILNDDFKTMLNNEFSDDEMDVMKKEAISEIIDSFPSETVSTERVEIIDQNTMKMTDLETGLELIYSKKR